MVVATLTPAVTGHYHVNGLANLALKPGHWAKCWLDTINSLGSTASPTPLAVNRESSSRVVPFAETGSVSVVHGAVIRELCETLAGDAPGDEVQQTAITATSVDKSAELGASRPSTDSAKRPQNAFTAPRGVKPDGAPLS
jgi:hypothetical protein